MDADAIDNRLEIKTELFRLGQSEMDRFESMITPPAYLMTVKDALPLAHKRPHVRINTPSGAAVLFFGARVVPEAGVNIATKQRTRIMGASRNDFRYLYVEALQKHGFAVEVSIHAQAIKLLPADPGKCVCGKQHDNWQRGDGAYLCQECWEKL